ncbi:MAG: polysaccharide biosynthesis/export family protein [Gemmatimonadetes bacterium]|nr:polysaccharide biosynthesis/export family protein [Gemmatimonadota bacterium]
MLAGLAMLAGLSIGGCGGPYYVEGQDELGDLPDSLRILIEEREKTQTEETQGREKDEGVLVRDLATEEAQPNTEPLPLEYAPESSYRLRRGDKLQIDVLFYPELGTATTVRPDGMITAPGVGDVRALGREPREVAADIEAYYSRLLRDPTTTINVVSFGERRAYVFGMVNRPGPVDLQQRMTLTQALATVGSMNEDAALATVVLLRRRSENTAQAYRLDIRGVLDGKSLAADVVLQPDDVIFVPRTFVANMEQFVHQVFQGLYPIPDLFIKSYDAIHVDERSALRRPVSLVE